MSETSRASNIKVACLYEAMARKPGNVHPRASFDDLTFDDFKRAAYAVAPVLCDADMAVGELVLDAVRATQAVTRGNVNLGIILLLAPLTRVDAVGTGDTRRELRTVLAKLTREDALNVQKAIALAKPGGMGKVASGDVGEVPECTLLEWMTMAADRDLIAAQYASGFADVFGVGVPAYHEGLARTRCAEGAVIWTQLTFMARFPDSLIARKCGREAAEMSSAGARSVLASGWPDTSDGAAEIRMLDDWLREDGNRRNPGTTADMVAATLYVVAETRAMMGVWTREGLPV